MYRKWFDIGWLPLFRIDQYPLLYKLSALLTVLFEISFLFLIFIPRLRIVAIVGGLLFHNITNALMSISFWTLQICYVVFIDWYYIYNKIKRYLDNKESKPAYSTNSTLKSKYPATVLIVGSFLVFGNMFSGFTNDMDFWFFSCYPTFQYVNRQPTTVELTIEAKDKNGKYKRIDTRKLSKFYGHARLNHVLQRLGHSEHTKKFNAFWKLLVESYHSLKNMSSE